ncbi:hypothetical protein ACFLXX_01760 [Chloroflexota bacterium]
MVNKTIQFIFAFGKRVYAFLILFASDPFDVSERWFGMNYNPPFWVFWLLLSLSIIFAVFMAIRDVRGRIKEEEVNLLNDIKAALITLNNCEKEVATKKAQKGLSMKKMNKVKADFRDYITTTGIPLLTNIGLFSTKEQMLDSLIKFFVGCGDVLDSNDYGLKFELADIAEYNNAKEDIAQKQVKLKTRKRSLIQTHIRKAMILAYGLNSVIVFRYIYRSSPEFQKAIPIQFNMMVESVERVGEKILSEMLNNFDSDWEKIIKIDFNEI